MKHDKHIRFARTSVDARETVNNLTEYLQTVNANEWHGHAPGTVMVHTISGDNDDGDTWAEVWRFAVRESWPIPKFTKVLGLPCYGIYDPKDWPEDLEELCKDPDTGLMVGDLVRVEFCDEEVTATITHLSMGLNDDDLLISEADACVVRIHGTGTRLAKMKKDLKPFET